MSVEGADQTKDVRTDASGSFEVTGLKPGSFKLKLHLPNELTAYKSERVLKFVSGGCASEIFNVGDNGSVSGRVLDAEGNPVSGIGVVLLPFTGWSSSSNAKTDAEGRYKASPLQANEYLVGINIWGLPLSVERVELPKDFLCPNCFSIVNLLRADQQASGYPPMFYPGVFQMAKAERLLLAPGQELRDVDFRLPPRLPESIVKGRVLRADGTPAAGALVGYQDVTYEDLKVGGYGVRANAQGEFSFKAYRGGRFVVGASHEANDARHTLGLTDHQTVVVTRPEESITLVINRFIK